MNHGHNHHGPNHRARRHGHSHAPADYGRAFALGIALNLLFVAVEAAYGFMSGSIALLADAGHNLADVLGLALAWLGATLAKRPGNARYTYGLRGSTILAALANALLLMIALGAIVLEAVQRLADPPPVTGTTMIVVAAIGVFINLGTALLFARGGRSDINIRGAFLHMAADAGVSGGVVAAGVLILWTGALWIDPVVSLLIAFVIFWSSWGLMREAIALSLAAAPGGIDVDEVAKALSGLPGVAAIHDLHIWAMSTTDTALTAHLVIPDGHPGDGFLADVQRSMHDRFGIGHVTLQVETGADARCRLAGAG